MMGHLHEIIDDGDYLFEQFTPEQEAIIVDELIDTKYSIAKITFYFA